MIRAATAGDLDAIMAIETGTFANDAWSGDTMATELTHPQTHYLVDEEEEGVVGYAGLLAPRGSAQADVQTIAVNAGRRREGRGRRLLEALIAEARARGARELFLEVRADNPGARALYEELGFELIGVRPNYYQPDGVDAEVMRAAL
jgi:ribosomal-protein-alanine acetyltransferase